MADELDVGLRLLANIRQQPVLRLAANPQRIGDMACRMVAAFVRMGGESSPWGVAWQVGEGKTEFRFAPEPRNRAAVQAMLLDFARALDDHFQDGELDLPQLFLPGPTHVDVLHFLAIRHARGRTGEPGALPVLQRMGRRCYDLFEATSNRNRTHCLDMTAVLRGLYAFPCEPAREAHLGMLVAWLDQGSAVAAGEAERLPVSTSIDPEVERRIQEQVDAFGKGKHDAAKSIGQVLEEELGRRISLTLRAISAASTVSENPGVAGIVMASRDALDRFAVQEAARGPGTVGGGPGLTGHAVADASGFVGHEADQIAAERALVPHDHHLQAQLIESGSGIEGSVQARSHVGIGRSRRTQLELDCPQDILIRFRVGDKLVATTAPAIGTEWRVDAIEQGEGQRRIRLVSSQSVDANAIPETGTPAARFCMLEDHGLKVRLRAKIREACSDDPTTRTPGQWILERMQETRDDAASADDAELDLSGAAPQEDTDATP
jgi:hypothetical protein